MINQLILKEVSDAIKDQITGLGRCQRTTELAHDLLALKGIGTTIVKGSACWRVGKHPLALVSFVDPKYLPYGVYYEVTPNPDGSFHQWLETQDGMILDFTTYNLRKTVHELDRIEGEKSLTPVTWSPDYLYENKNKVISAYKVLNGKTDRLFFYKV